MLGTSLTHATRATRVAHVQLSAGYAHDYVVSQTTFTEWRLAPYIFADKNIVAPAFVMLKASVG